jgi:hypothetical protein
MAQEKSNGGPSFPTMHHDQGMTLRDWFAGQALAGWLASFTSDDAVKAEGCARLAYQLADAMIARRDQK